MFSFYAFQRQLTLTSKALLATFFSFLGELTELVMLSSTEKRRAISKLTLLVLKLLLRYNYFLI